MNPLLLLWQLMLGIVSFYLFMYGVLTMTITIGSWEFQVWTILLGGQLGVALALLIARFVKMFVPVAQFMQVILNLVNEILGTTSEISMLIIIALILVVRKGR